MTFSAGHWRAWVAGCNHQRLRRRWWRQPPHLKICDRKEKTTEDCLTRAVEMMPSQSTNAWLSTAGRGTGRVMLLFCVFLFFLFLKNLVWTLRLFLDLCTLSGCITGVKICFLHTWKPAFWRRHNLERGDTNHLHTQTLAGVFGCYFSEQWEANRTAEEDRNRDTAPVNKQHPMATAMATHTLTHMEQV